MSTMNDFKAELRDLLRPDPEGAYRVVVHPGRARQLRLEQEANATCLGWRWDIPDVIDEDPECDYNTWYVVPNSQARHYDTARRLLAPVMAVHAAAAFEKAAREMAAALKYRSIPVIPKGAKVQWVSPTNDPWWRNP